MIYVEFKKKFFLDDSSELMGVRLISASWAQKTFDSHFLVMMYFEFMKIFFLADSSKLICVGVISASWAQKRLFPLSRHDVRRVYKKFFSSWFARTDGC